MELTFALGGEIVIVKIDGKNILFSDAYSNFQIFSPFEKLRLTEDGMLKEFPDLKNLSYEDMREETIKRFKERINKMETEGQVKDYVIKEMENMSYKLQTIRREGFRPIMYR